MHFRVNIPGLSGAEGGFINSFEIVATLKYSTLVVTRKFYL